MHGGRVSINSHGQTISFGRGRNNIISKFSNIPDRFNPSLSHVTVIRVCPPLQICTLRKILQIRILPNILSTRTHPHILTSRLGSEQNLLAIRIKIPCKAEFKTTSIIALRVWRGSVRLGRPLSGMLEVRITSSGSWKKALMLERTRNLFTLSRDAWRPAKLIRNLKLDWNKTSSNVFCDRLGFWN